MDKQVKCMIYKLSPPSVFAAKSVSGTCLVLQIITVPSLVPHLDKRLSGL